MAITKFKTPDGREHEGLVVWLDVGDQRTKFVLSNYWTIWPLLHCPSGMRVADAWCYRALDAIEPKRLSPAL